MDKQQILENQIASLKDIIDIQEKQLNSKFQDCEEFLTQWRIKVQKQVYELLVQKKYLQNQNSEYQKIITKLKKEKEESWKKVLNDVAEKESGIALLKQKIEALELENDDQRQKIEYLNMQNKLAKNEVNNAQSSFLDTLRRIKKHYDSLMLQMKERFQYRAEELHDRILKLDSTVMNVKLSYIIAKTIHNLKTESLNFKKKLQTIIQDFTRNHIEKYDVTHSESSLINFFMDFFTKYNLIEQDLKFAQETVQRKEILISEIASTKRELDKELREQKEANVILEKKVKELDRANQDYIARLQAKDQINRELEDQRVELDRKVRELTLRLEDENNKSFRTERDYQEIINQLKKEKETAINNTVAEYKELIQKVEKQKDEIIESLKTELELVTELKEKETKHRETLQEALERQNEKVISLSNQVHELFKNRERNQELEKFRREKQYSKDFGPSILRETMTSKKNQTLDFGTPVSKISHKISKFDENKSPIRLDYEKERPSVISHKKDQSFLLSKFEAVEKMAHDILNDDDL